MNKFSIAIYGSSQVNLDIIADSKRTFRKDTYTLIYLYQGDERVKTLQLSNFHSYVIHNDVVERPFEKFTPVF